MLRPYQDSDFEDCSFLNKQAYLRPCTENELRGKLGAGKAWVWGIRGAVVGCIIICPQDGKDFVWSITVAEKWRGRNIGNALMAEAERHFSELWLHTEPTGRAKRMYRGRGYQTVQIEKDFYGPGQDAELMVKRG